MADQHLSPAADGPQVQYLNGAILPDGKLPPSMVGNHKEAFSAYEIHVDKNDPNRATMIPATGNHEKLIPNYRNMVDPVFAAVPPDGWAKFINVEKPAQLVREGDSWRMVERGEASYSQTPKVQQTQAQAPAPVQAQPTPAQEGPAKNEVKLVWNQIDKEGAPLEDIRNYLRTQRFDTPGGIKVERGLDGKLKAELTLSYTPGDIDAAKVQGMLQGLKEGGKGHRLEVFENHEQERARQQSIPVTQKDDVLAARSSMKNELAPDAWPSNAKALEKYLLTPEVGQGQAKQTATEPQIENKPTTHRFQVGWRQVDGEGAPLEAIVDYLGKNGIKLDNQIAVKPNAEGQLTSRLNFSFDPAKVDNTLVHGIIGGINETGRNHGMKVFENKEQAAERGFEIFRAGTERNQAATGARHAFEETIGSNRDTKTWPLESTGLNKFLSSEATQATQQQTTTQTGPAVDEKKEQQQTTNQTQSTANPTQEPKEQAQAAPKTAASLGLDANPPVAPTPTASVADEAKPGVGQLQVMWKQTGNEVAPLTEIRAYLAELKDSGVAVGAMKFDKGPDGKYSGNFGVTYDPNSQDLAKLEGTIQGLKKVGGGLTIVEPAQQAADRRQVLGNDGLDKALDLAFPVKEAFNVKQWDSLSAHLSSAPKHVLTGPEQAQQAAGIERVEQLARQQGKPKEQVIQEGKNLLEIDTTGNPVSAFLKNFYEHLTGAAKTRQSLEVDYEKTRQELQDKLIVKAGTALTDGQLTPATENKLTAQAASGLGVAGLGASAARPSGPTPEGAGSIGSTPPSREEIAKQIVDGTPKVFDNKPIEIRQVTAAEMARIIKQAQAGTQTPDAATAKPEVTPAATKAEYLFKESELPKDKLALFGLNLATLRESGQLEKLMNGEKTDLLAMQGGAQRDKPLIDFSGKLVLHREANGSVTLNVELPKQKLTIPNEIGGQPFTEKQKENLQNFGTAGLMHNLKDAAGNTYSGFVGVDKDTKTIVILPEKAVREKDLAIVAGVKLSPEQTHDLKDGQQVHVANLMPTPTGRAFDGTVHINAAKGSVEIRPETYEVKPKQQAEISQATPAYSEKNTQSGQKPATETKQVTQEAPAKAVESPKEEQVQQRGQRLR